MKWRPLLYRSPSHQPRQAIAPAQYYNLQCVSLLRPTLQFVRNAVNAASVQSITVSLRVQWFVSNLCPWNSWWKLYLVITYCMQQSPSWETNRFSDTQDIPRFKRNRRRFIITLTSTCHLYLSWASSIQSILTYRNIWKSFILSLFLQLCLPSGVFPSEFPNQTLNTPNLSFMHATYPAHLIISMLSTEISWVTSRAH